MLGTSHSHLFGNPAVRNSCRSCAEDMMPHTVWFSSMGSPAATTGRIALSRRLMADGRHVIPAASSTLHAKGSRRTRPSGLHLRSRRARDSPRSVFLRSRVPRDRPCGTVPSLSDVRAARQAGRLHRQRPPQRHAANERNAGLDTKREAERHRLADVRPGLRDHADVLLWGDDARHAHYRRPSFVPTVH